MPCFPKRIYPTRGIIYDHRQRAILNNTILYDLMVTPSQVKNHRYRFFLPAAGNRYSGIPFPHSRCENKKRSLPSVYI